MGGRQALTAGSSVVGPAGKEPSSAVQTLLRAPPGMPRLADESQTQQQAARGTSRRGTPPRFRFTSWPPNRRSQLTQRGPGDPEHHSARKWLPRARRLEPQKQEAFGLSLLDVGTELKRDANAGVGKRSSQMVPGEHPCQAGQGNGPGASGEQVREEEDAQMAGLPAEEGSVGLKMAPQTLPLLPLGSERCWAQRESRGRVRAAFGLRGAKKRCPGAGGAGRIERGSGCARAAACRGFG